MDAGRGGRDRRNPGVKNMQGSILFFLERQRCRVDAVAQTGGGGPVWKIVPEMRSATTAQRLGTYHAVAGVGFFGHRVGVQGLIKTWPAGARVELGRRREQRFATGGAVVFAMLVMVPVLAGKRPFGPMFAQDAVLLGALFSAPFGVGFGFFFVFGFLCLFLCVSVWGWLWLFVVFLVFFLF